MLGSLLVACGGGRDRGDDEGDGDAGPVVRADVGPGVDTGPGGPGDAGPGTDAGTGPCEPMPGPMTGDTYCDLFELAIFTAPDATPEARLWGRVNGGPGTGCTVIDEVEVLEGGTTVTTLPGAGRFEPGSERAFLASGLAVPQMTARCDRDDARFGGFGLLVRGRYDGGSFEAHCADAEFGSRWPPALRITCHENVDDRPFTSYAMVSVSPMFSHTTLDVTVPHGPGAALTTVESTIRVIPGAASWAPPAPDPFDAADWTTFVSEGSAPLTGPSSNLHLTTDRAAFGTDICPPPMMGMPDPGEPPPPVFLVRLRGTGERGPYSTEAYVNYCFTTSS